MKACWPTETSPAYPARRFQYWASASIVKTKKRSCNAARPAKAGSTASRATTTTTTAMRMRSPKTWTANFRRGPAWVSSAIVLSVDRAWEEATRPEHQHDQESEMAGEYLP